MRRQGIFWGSMILLLGVFLLLQTLGIVSFNVWPVFWAVFLILLGVWFLFGSRLRRGSYAAESLSIPRGGASQAAVEFHHAGGKLTLSALAGTDPLLEGSFTGGVVHTLQPGSMTRVKLSAEAGVRYGAPWSWPDGLVWDVKLARGLPLELEFHTGACESNLDLTDLDVTSLRLETGASATRVTLPAKAQHTSVTLKGGLAAINLFVPQGVAARIQVKSGLAGVKIDTGRFPMSGEYYESPDYNTAPYRVEIFAETGMGSVEVQ